MRISRCHPSTAVFLSLSLSLSSPTPTRSHGTMIIPRPLQPESVYWYQVGCVVGCECSGGGKENYPTPASMNCTLPLEPTHTDPGSLTWNVDGASPRGEWNRYAPWRAPGHAIPLDSCGIASGFLPSAKVQYPYSFSQRKSDGGEVTQGERGSELPRGEATTWVAGSIVEASFYLNVNHGGGYQYRVCPRNDGVAPDEACFERNPLSFATDTHVVVLGGDDGGHKITIPATDVSAGTRPAGSTWRRIPLPACNCDAGHGCAFLDAKDDFASSYADGEAYGSCGTGLQFDAPHIVDGSWPEGYGYYVASLGKDGKGNECRSYSNATSCVEDSGNGCGWYEEKDRCYEVRNSKNGGGKGDDKDYADGCSSHSKKGEDSCVGAQTKSGEPCTWYDDGTKTACYDRSQQNKRRLAAEDEDDKNTGTKTTENDGKWHIADKLIAPSETGEYVLQWRWDNEQTPQIWTTCADILVAEADGSGARGSSVGSSGLVVSLAATAAWMVEGW